MKKIILTFFLAISQMAFAQTLTFQEVQSGEKLNSKRDFYKEYIASNGVVYAVGDTYKIGEPSISSFDGKNLYKEWVSVAPLNGYGFEVPLNNHHAVFKGSQKKWDKAKEQERKNVEKANKNNGARYLSIKSIWIQDLGANKGQVCFTIHAYNVPIYHVYIETAIKEGEL